jgi:hypothetical protein
MCRVEYPAGRRLWMWDGGDSSNWGKERARYCLCSGSSPTQQAKPAGRDKAFGIAQHWMDRLGVTAACGTCARNRSLLRGSRLTNWRHGRTALRRNPRRGWCLPRTRLRLAAGAATRLAPPMKTTTRRSLRRAWRVMTWPLAGHIVFALGIGFACGIAATRYPEVMTPTYAAILGTVLLYPVMVIMWWRLHPSGGRRR